MRRSWPTRFRRPPALTPVQPFWAIIQRGGSPTVRDRVNASLMGYHAIDLLDKGIYNRVVAVSGDKIVDYDVNVALSMHKTIDRDMMIEIAKAISI